MTQNPTTTASLYVAVPFSDESTREVALELATHTWQERAQNLHLQLEGDLTLAEVAPGEALPSGDTAEVPCWVASGKTAPAVRAERPPAPAGYGYCAGCHKPKPLRRQDMLVMVHKNAESTKLCHGSSRAPEQP